MNIPRCCPRCRLDALNVLELLFVEDAFAEVDAMVAAGFGVTAAREVVAEDYLAWITARIGEAVRIGVELHELEAAA